MQARVTVLQPFFAFFGCPAELAVLEISYGLTTEQQSFACY